MCALESVQQFPVWPPFVPSLGARRVLKTEPGWRYDEVGVDS